jgi:hypothetical protein
MFYKFLFFCIHRMAIFLGNEGFFPEALAYFGTAMLPWLNFITIINYLEIQTGNQIFSSSLIIFIYVVYLIAIYLYFFTRGRHRRILDEAKNSSSKTLWYIIVAVYAVSSLIAHFVVSDWRRSISTLTRNLMIWRS